MHTLSRSSREECAEVRLSNRLSRCSTAGVAQHVSRWYAVASAPNTLLANLKSSSLGTAKKDLRCTFVADFTQQDITRLPTKICSGIHYQQLADMYGNYNYYMYIQVDKLVTVKISIRSDIQTSLQDVWRRLCYLRKLGKIVVLPCFSLHVIGQDRCHTCCTYS